MFVICILGLLVCAAVIVYFATVPVILTIFGAWSLLFVLSVLWGVWRNRKTLRVEGR